MHTRTLYAACLLAAAALPSFANDVPFERIGAGAGAFNVPAGTYVAKSRAELDQQGLTPLLDAQSLSGIDWSTEMVLGAFMGSQSSGGYAISIERIERRQLPQIQPVPGPPPVFELAVQVMRVSPGPGDIVTFAFTAPYQLVKVARSDDLISFEDLPTHLAFDRFTRAIGGYGFARSIQVAGDGSVTITTQQGGFGGPAQVDRGSIDAGRVGRLQALLARAEFTRLPEDMGISGALPVPADAPVTTYIRDFNGQTQRVSGFRPHADPQVDRRLDLIDRELEQVADEVLSSFDAEIKGIVRVQGDVVELEGPHSSVLVDDAAMARVLRQFVGRTVKLTGDLEPTRITDASIVYPQRLEGQTALVETDAAGDAAAILPGGRVETFGAAAAALALGEGRQVTLSGYLFLDAQQQPAELYVESVQATMTRFSYQTVRGVITGFLRRGDVVTVDRLSGTGRYARAADSETAGYVRVNRLRVGDPIPAIQPHPTTGITGALPGQ